MKAGAAAVVAILMIGAWATTAARGPDAARKSAKQFAVHPIGYVKKAEDRATIVLDRKYEPGLLGLDGFSHVYVFWWFDRNDRPDKRSILQVHPRGNRQNPLTGVFATRAPVRPNLIALSLCRIISIEGNVVEVESIDAFADTPVLDIKPYIPGYDTASEAVLPAWLND
jgi:tRNA-Thr(GGU) m(6)t(6)A37 methyltransferase TsaA